MTNPTDTNQVEVTIGTKQCVEVSLYMYKQWEEAMKPPLYAYYDFPTWLKKVMENSDD